MLRHSAGYGLVLALLLFALPVFAASKIVDVDTVQYKLDKFDTVRVIVKIDVPRYALLRTASAAFDVVAPNQEADVAAAQTVDQALGQAIANAADVVQGQLSSGTATRERVFSYLPYVVYTVDAEGLADLASLPGVLAIEEDKPTPLPEQPEVLEPEDVSKPALTTSTTLIGANTLWSQGYTGQNYYVAVLDTGIRSTHEMFSGKTIVEACFTSKYSSNPNATLCPNGTDQQIGAGSARHYYNLQGIDGGWDHGTHVAGISSGKNPAGTVKGVAPSSNIVAVQVFSDGFTSTSCGGKTNCALSYTSDQLLGLEYVYSLRSSYPISSVNMSLGGGNYSSACDSDSRKSAIDLLRAAGIATAIATGNNGYCGYIGAPACISSSVAVGASDDSDVIASFSNWADSLTPLFAPGVQIYSSTADSDTSYESWNGTSMATPHVAGAWALLRSYKNDASVNDILSALTATGQNVTFNRCGSPTGITRRIQVDQAAQRLQPVATSQGDVWWRNVTSGANTIWYMDGVTPTSGVAATAINAAWNVACLHDFNGDGETDVMWRNPSSGADILALMNGVTIAGFLGSLSIPYPWTIGACADFNGDGAGDLLWHNPTNGRTAITFLTSDAKLNGPPVWLPTYTTNWQPRGAADLSGDSNADILWRNASTGQVVAVLMSGYTVSGAAAVTTIADTNWDIKGLADFNKDNSPDLLWRNGSTGANVAQFLTHASPSGAGALPTISPRLGWDIGGAAPFK